MSFYDTRPIGDDLIVAARSHDRSVVIAVSPSDDQWFRITTDGARGPISFTEAVTEALDLRASGGEIRSSGPGLGRFVFSVTRRSMTRTHTATTAPSDTYDAAPDQHPHQETA